MENGSKKKPERVVEQDVSLEELKEEEEYKEDVKAAIESGDSNKRKSAFGNYNILNQMRQS